MSQFLQTNPTKRSTSLCLDTPLNQADSYYSHQIDQRNCQFEKESPVYLNENSTTIFTESIPSTTNNLMTPMSSDQPSVSNSSYVDVEKLSLLTYQLKLENKELTSRLGEIDYFQQRIHELETQYKQLQKETSLKASSPSKRLSVEKVPVKVNQSRPNERSSPSPQRDRSYQNKAATDEVKSLKNQIETLKKQNKELEDEKTRLEELELQLEEANVQMEFLNNELESKDYELRGLREEVGRLNEEKSQFGTLAIQQQKDKESELVNENNKQRPDSQILPEDFVFLQDLSEQLLKKLTFCEEETKILKEKTLEKDYEIEDLRNQLVRYETEAAMGLDGDQKDADGISKGFWQETINQMLLEKANYKVKVIELESQLDILKTSQEKTNREWEEKVRQIEREVVKAREERDKAEQELRHEIERLRAELVEKHNDQLRRNNEESRPLQPEINTDELVSEIELLKKKLAQKEQEQAKEKEKYIENTLITGKSMKFLKECNEQNEENRKRLEENVALLESELAIYKQREQETESQMASLLDQNQTLNNLVQEFESERNENNKTIEGFIFKEEESEIELAELKKQSLDTKELMIKHMSEKRRQEHEISHLKAQIEEFKEELNSLYQTLEQRKEDCVALGKQNEQLKKENLQLKNSLKGGEKSRSDKL